jgi:hypothetical protein
MQFYETRIPAEIDRVKEYAANLLAKFNSGIAPADLLVDAKNLKHLYDALCAQLPGDVRQAGSFGRHLAFMIDHLVDGHPEHCLCDIDDICNLDLPAIEQSFRKWCNAPDHVDREIKEKVYGLLQRGEYDSAIRKGFVILKERLCAVYGIAKDKDGSELVNLIYGKQTSVTPALPAEERQAMRDLVAGLYGVFRNKYGHNDVKPAWQEVDAVLSMINCVLKKLPPIRSPRVAQGLAQSTKRPAPSLARPMLAKR